MLGKIYVSEYGALDSQVDSTFCVQVENTETFERTQAVTISISDNECTESPCLIDSSGSDSFVL